ncbi:MAG: DUF4453 domain-containing protein [Paracoccaceae bacterium]
MMIRLTILATIAAMSVQAEEVCNDLWFARNSVFDAAGYCFGSPLGKSLYDNTGCTTSNPTLSAEDRQKVSIIEQREKELGCTVDTTTTTFDLTALKFRKLLREQPIRSSYESACIGWKGPKVEVTSGPQNGDAVGSIDVGDSVLYSHEEEDGWFYVTVWSPPAFGALKVAGWLPGLGDAQSCEDFAG